MSEQVIVRRGGPNTAGRRRRLRHLQALEEFFEEYGVPVARAGEIPDGLEPPDFAAMAAALERNEVRIVARPEAVR